MFFDSLIGGGAHWTLYSPDNSYVTRTNLLSDFETTLQDDGTYLLILSGYVVLSGYDNRNYSFKVTNPPIAL